MDLPQTVEHGEHVIDVIEDRHDNTSNSQQTVDLAVATPDFQRPLSTTTGTNERTQFGSRRDDHGRLMRLLTSRYWIPIELVITVSQIIAAVIVLSLSRHEHPHAPLFTWVVGYAIGCAAALPLRVWPFHHRNVTGNQGPQPPSARLSAGANVLFSSLNATPSVAHTHNTTDTRPTTATLGARLKVPVEYYKKGLDFFSIVWFVLGNVWIFGGRSSATDAPILYRLCLVFLIFTCIEFAIPIILGVTICCCVPRIPSVVDLREDFTRNRGATTESINSMPTYKFKITKHKDGKIKENHLGANEGGVVAAGTKNERVLSGEDAVCCICLAKYGNNDELRELPCTHFFHKDCVDKWLKINASCPLSSSTSFEAKDASSLIIDLTIIYFQNPKDIHKFRMQIFLVKEMSDFRYINRSGSEDEQNLTEFDESFQANESSRCSSSDLSDNQSKEKVEDASES
ncbi:hypothetical protein SSX86_004461 [Deinandra increscens subsp. villosa]|uniref:RING-type domain-containing protein n=1 Tax=Deinandra increscens subsp. villosa TaxID=3103831 RepID=A0AAP0DN78_9ASTR